MLNRMIEIIQTQGWRGLSRKAWERIFIRSFMFGVDLGGEYPDSPFQLVPLDAKLLSAMRKEYPVELPDWKHTILAHRLVPGSKYHGFAVMDGEDICGYFHVAVTDFTDDVIGFTHRLPPGEVLLFDDYTFSPHRNKGVHRFSVKARMAWSSNNGYHAARVNIFKGNIASERAYRSAGFLPMLELRTFRMPLRAFTIEGPSSRLVKQVRIGLRKIIADVIARSMIYSGRVDRALRKLDQEGTILCAYFHAPDRALFEGCLKWYLAKSFRLISSDELLAILTSGVHPGGRLAHLSLDDGWRSNLTEVVPVAQERGIPLTIFISTQPVIEGPFWWSYAGICPGATDRFKSISESIRRDKEVELKCNYHPEREAMLPIEVPELSSKPGVTLGSHTAHHVVTPRCTPEQLESEIVESTQILSHWTKEDILYFAYPNGDYDGREFPILTRLGYRLAFTTVAAPTIPGRTKPFEVPRFCGIENGTLRENICRISGVWQRIFR